MRKYSIAAALLIAVLAVSGCSGNSQTSGQNTVSAAADTPADGAEYIEVLKEAFHEYANSSFPFANDLQGLDFDAAEKDLDNMDASLNRIENIVAPSQYTDLQKKLLDSIGTERGIIGSYRKFIVYYKKGDMISDEEARDMQKLIEELGDPPAVFTETYLEVVKTVQADIDK